MSIEKTIPLSDAQSIVRVTVEEIGQLRRERDAWATHCKRAEAEVADLLERNRELQARVDARDMRGIAGELRLIQDRLHNGQERMARSALSDLLRRIDRESQEETR